MAVEFSINYGKVWRNLRRAQAQGPQALGRELFKFASEVMTDSQQNFVPYDKGDLAASGRVDPPFKDTNGAMAVRMYYGGKANAYALAVHEHLSESSPPSWKVAESEGRGIKWTKSGTGPKYLELPLMRRSHLLPESAGVAFRSAFEGMER